MSWKILKDSFGLTYEQCLIGWLYMQINTKRHVLRQSLTEWEGTNVSSNLKNNIIRLLDQIYVEKLQMVN